MNRPLPRPGHPLELEIDSEKTRGQLFASEVVEVQPSHLYLTWPQAGRFLAPIRAGTRLRVGYVEGASFCTFVTTALGARDHFGERVLAVEAPKEAPVVRARRGAARVEVTRSAVYTLADGSATYETVTKDVSSDGICVLSPAAVEPGTRVRVEVEAGAGQPLVLEGEVASCALQGLSVPRSWLVGIRFDNPSAEMRRLLVAAEHGHARYFLRSSRASGFMVLEGEIGSSRTPTDFGTF